MLIGPMRSLGVTLGLAQRATASGARIFQVLDRDPRIVERPERRPLPPGNGHVQLRGVTLRYDESDEFGAAYVHAGGREAAIHSKAPGNGPERRAPGGARRAVRRRPRRPGRHDGRARRRHRLGQDEPRLADLAAVRRERGRGAARRRRRARRCSCARCARRSRSSATTRSCSRRPSPRTSPTGAPTHRARRSKRRRGARRPTASSASCRRATTPVSASAACRCPAASASGSRSHARC